MANPTISGIGNNATRLPPPLPTTTTAIRHQEEQGIRTRTAVLSPDYLMKQVEDMYFQTIIFVLLLVIASLPMAKLIVGILYLNQCPCRPNLNVWLIVGGIRGLIMVFLWILLVRSMNSTILMENTSYSAM